MTLPPHVGDMAERIVIMLIERYLERAIAKFGRVASATIDEWAANWLIARAVLSRDLALELLEDLGKRVGAEWVASLPRDVQLLLLEQLGKRVGARIEVSDPL